MKLDGFFISVGQQGALCPGLYLAWLLIVWHTLAFSECVVGGQGCF